MNKKKSLSNRILFVLRQDPKMQYNALTIDRILYGKIRYDKKERKKNVQQIWKELDRLVKRGHVIKPQRGFYSLRITAKTLHLLDNPPIVCHGIKIEATMTHQGTPHNSILGITSKNPNFDIKNWFLFMGFEETTNKRWVKRFFWDGRFITLTVHPKCGLIEVWIKCTENPMDFTSMFRFNEFIKGYLSPITSFGDAMIREIGVNKDFRELRLDGVSGMSLHVFLNSWSRIYYKESIGAVRAEAHWVGSIDFQDCLQMLALINAPPDRKGVKKIVEDVMFH